MPEERSQHKNRARAMSWLSAKLNDMQTSAAQNAIATERKLLVGSGDRSERIRTYNYPQGRVTDHRINLTLYSWMTFWPGASMRSSNPCSLNTRPISWPPWGLNDHHRQPAARRAVAGFPDRAPDVELLLAAALGKSRSYLHTWPERIVSSEAAETFAGYRRVAEPVSRWPTSWASRVLEARS